LLIGGLTRQSTHFPSLMTSTPAPQRKSCRFRIATIPEPGEQAHEDISEAILDLEMLPPTEELSTELLESALKAHCVQTAEC
jgi:hypothetical protein